MDVCGACSCVCVCACVRVGRRRRLWCSVHADPPQAVGVFVIELSGKRRYYQKKAAYYELAALEIQQRDSNLRIGVQVI